MRYDYTVVISGQDYEPDYGWADEHYHIMDVPCDSYEDAVAFCESITTEQVLEWEQESGCNGLDVAIFKDEVNDDGSYTFEFSVVGEYEWIGPNRNEPPIVWKEA